jgi:hypothetical protein
MFRIHNTVTLNLKPLEAYKRRFRNPKSPEMRPVMNQWRKRYLKYIKRRYKTNSKGGGDWPGLKPATIFARNHKGKDTKKAISYTSRLSGLNADQKKDYRRAFNRAKKSLADKMNKSATNKQVVALARAHAARKLRSAGAQIDTRNQIGAKLMAAGKVSILQDTGTLINTLDVSRSDNWKFISNGMQVGFLKGKSAKHRSGKRSLSVADIAGIHQFGKGRNPVRRIIVDPDKQTTDGMIRDLMRATK